MKCFLVSSLVVGAALFAGRQSIDQAPEARATFTYGDNIWGLAFSADGKKLGAAGDGGMVRVWDTASHREWFAFRHETQRVCAAFSPGGRVLVTGGPKEKLVLWELALGRDDS